MNMNMMGNNRNHQLPEDDYYTDDYYYGGKWNATKLSTEKFSLRM
jgi:hypothetical protein